MESLIGKKYKFAPDASLFFLLLIADALEPIKRINPFSEDKIESLINHIFIEADNDMITVSCDSKIDSFDSKKWIEEIKQLGSWLDFGFKKDPLKVIIIINK